MAGNENSILDAFKHNQTKEVIDESRKLKVGIIGCGWIADAHMVEYLRMPDVEVVAGADLVPGKAEAFFKKHGVNGARCYANHAELLDNEELDALLEEQSLYWNDDKFVVDTFVIKTIKRFEEEKGALQQLLPEYKDVADMDFARRLFRTTIANAEEYRTLMSGSSKNWDMQRLAFMDVVIMQAALAEILTFDDVPLSVTLNEYVEIAKHYSTAKSGSFVNGLLDSITKKLRQEGKLNK